VWKTADQSRQQNITTMMHWNNDDELFSLIKKELFTAVVGDMMDTMGFQQQFLPPQILPLNDSMVLAGRAMTVLEQDTPSSPDNDLLKRKPFGLMLEALDDLKRNEIYVCTGASPAYALWGELMTARAVKLGAAGAVVNGYIRDKKSIVDGPFPVFSYGSYAQDQAPRGKVVDFRIPIEMLGVTIQVGDILVGDMDGVCVVPQEIEREVFVKALEKARGEKVVKKAIMDGMSAKKAFEAYGIL
jgi:regulator of RNase E activity RraA